MPLAPNQGFIFESGKVYAHSVGLSCCFRQWRSSDSHCRFLHGYALKVELTFRVNSSSGELDSRNWVMGFGDLKAVKKYLEDTFDHKTLIAQDDPQLSTFQALADDPNTDELQDTIYETGQAAPVIQLVIVENVGCEAFAKMIYEAVDNLIPITVRLQEVKVSEHEGNWASYKRNS